MSTAALERQIRPIYDAIDIGSNKSAIVSCNKILKKHPDNDLVKALKSLALFRAQKVEESLVLCDEVLAAKPSNDATLSAMIHVLRALGRHNDMVTMFEEAYKQQPGNEDLAAQTFFANVRAQRWKFAQQIAQKMHKTFNTDDRYLYWHVMCIKLQADDPSTPEKMTGLLLQLAHRLLASATTPFYASADRFFLHLTILKQLSLYEDAYKLFTTEVGQKICETNLYCNEIRREIMVHLGKWKEEGERAQKLIVDNKDRNWLEFISVLDATFADVTKSEDITEEARTSTASAIAQSQEIFEGVEQNDGRKDRSGLLALVDLETRARKHGFSTDPSKIQTLLQKYFTVFGDKACCFEDLKPYLGLDETNLKTWTEFLHEVSPSNTTLEDLQRLINSHKLLRYSFTTDELSVELESQRATTLVSQYMEALPFGADLPTTELQPADDLAVLAANVYVNLYRISSEEKWLWACVSLLEFGLTRSRQSWQMRLLLVRLYRLLGSPEQALEHYRLLNLKTVQHDTLTHILLSRSSLFSLSAMGDLTFTSECLETTQVYLSNSQETSEFVVRAFLQEKYSQVADFISFEDRLDNSLQRDIIKIEHLKMRLAHEPINTDIVDMELIELKFIFDRLHYDNRDLTVIPNYQPAANSQHLGDQLQLWGIAEGHGYLASFLKLYVRILQHASDLDDTVEEKLLICDRPKPSVLDPSTSEPLRDRLSQRKPEELAELSKAEQALVRYADALTEWLEDHHDHVRPPAAVVLAEASRNSVLKTGHPLKGIDVDPAMNGQHNAKKSEDAPPVRDPPAYLEEFFDELKVMFDEAKASSSHVEALHAAAMVQEALLLLVIESLRFKTASTIKIHKLGNLAASLKTLRTKALTVAKEVAKALPELAVAADSAEQRKSFTDEATAILDSKVEHDFILDVAKKVGDSRSKVLKGFGTGLEKVCKTYNNAS